MDDTLLRLMQDRHSERVRFEPNRRVPIEQLRMILEAARWAPTAHNMQNFQVVAVDDEQLLAAIGNIQSQISEVFVRENYLQLSFSEGELVKKKVGILASRFPKSWTTPGATLEETTVPLKNSIDDSPLLLLVIYDPTRRAPGSAGDVLGMISLGCVLENMWLMAQSLGISFQVLSVFSTASDEVKRMLRVPGDWNIAFACRLGYPASKADRSPRVRRDLAEFIHHNMFGQGSFG
jgi:nitroreductase